MWNMYFLCRTVRRPSDWTLHLVSSGCNTIMWWYYLASGLHCVIVIHMCKNDDMYKWQTDCILNSSSKCIVHCNYTHNFVMCIHIFYTHTFSSKSICPQRSCPSWYEGHNKSKAGIWKGIGIGSKQCGESHTPCHRSARHNNTVQTCECYMWDGSGMQCECRCCCQLVSPANSKWLKAHTITLCWLHLRIYTCTIHST